jgi:hypothetical protein
MRIFLTLGFAAVCAPAWAAMPAAEQNALVKTYCVVCHTDAARNGGLSLEHYDAAKRDPSLAAMMLSKLNTGAMGAAGKGVPDKTAQQAWLDSTKEQAAAAKDWFVRRESGVVSASIVREVPPRHAGSTAPVYRVILVCNSSTRSGEMQLTWSPQPQTGRTMTASVDGEAPVEYQIEGKESMGNGGVAQTGHASIVLRSREATRLPFANHTLAVRDLFPGETVEFPFADLDQRVRSELSACF